MATIKLTQERIARILARCTSPGAASKAAERVFELAKRRHAEARALGALSGALHEYRHVLLQRRAGNAEQAAHHASNVQRELARAVLAAEVAR